MLAHKLAHKSKHSTNHNSNQSRYSSLVLTKQGASLLDYFFCTYHVKQMHVTVGDLLPRAQQHPKTPTRRT